MPIQTKTKLECIQTMRLTQHFILGTRYSDTNVLPFALVNEEATCQRMVKKLLKNMLGRIIEAKVENIIVKFIKGELYVYDL